ncbi:MAG TPA: S8 family serine peptidase [Jatrophihabitantaceae bacterium]
MSRAVSRRALFAIAASVAALAVVPTGVTAASAAPPTPKAAVVYPHLTLPGGEWAQVYSDGMAEVHAARGAAVKIEQLPMASADGTDTAGAALQLPAKGDVIADLARGPATPYASDQVLVVYKSGVTPALKSMQAQLGVDRSRPMFSAGQADKLASMHAAAERETGQPLLDVAGAQVLHVTGSSVADAVAKLRASSDVAYAGPNWTVSTTHVTPQPVSTATLHAATRAAAQAAPNTAGLPNNYALTSSAQSLLNRPGVDAVPAFAQLAKYGQLPGQGEIITNVSLGTLTDASQASDASDPCNFYAANYGPTTIVQDGQRYLDWPSMPLIPTYTASSSGVLDPTGSTCGDDPGLAEIGLDFSMMAPLPHDAQRPDALGNGLTDLLGIAPGAQYRLIVPSTAGGNVSDVDATFLAAASQTPRPDVITASLGFGYDQYGFASRYLEEDPMTQAVVATIVHGFHIVVCVSAGDGLRTYTNGAVPTSGGSVATDVGTPTDLNDVAFSDSPSRVRDSGAIDVGGTTLDDIFSAPPGDRHYAALRAQHAFPATRYNGAKNYSTGFGTRVNVSAPGDSVLSFSHPLGTSATTVEVDHEGGTSASTPEVAAAAAIVLQAARLVHNRQLQNDPLAVRDLLERTGTAVPAISQEDAAIHIGPQVDVARAVAAVLGDAQPGVARVAVEQRQQASALGGSFNTATDPTNVSLTGRLADAWITVSPDWTGLDEPGVRYDLSVGRHHLAPTPWARLQPADILGAAGLPLESTTARTVHLTYTATSHGRTTSVDVPITFGPTDGTTPSVVAPVVPSVVRGATIPVHYDISRLTGATNPILVVSQPGRIENATGLYFRPAYTAPLTVPVGTVNVPVSALPGAGIYGIGIQNAPGGWFSNNDSTFAFTRVAPPSDARPAPPTLNGGHYAEIPDHGSFQLSYDVRNVPGATGAIVEFSAPGPTPFNDYKTFNNPNGSQRDANGHDSGSVSSLDLRGTHGTVTLNGDAMHLDPSMNHVVRVLPTRSGRVVGEGSGVSSISMDGVFASDGGSAAAGFGVNENGTDGFITSNQVTADGQKLGSIETFDQATGKITSTVTSSADTYSTISGACAGIVGGDTGLYQDSSGYHVLANGKPAGDWTPPDSLGDILCIAPNQSTPDTAVLGNADNHLIVSSSNVAQNTFSQPVDLSPGLVGANGYSVGAFAQDAQSHQAVVGVYDGTDTPRIIVAGLDSGDVHDISGVTSGFSYGGAVDSSTHQALLGSYGGVGIYDLPSGNGTLAQPGGATYEHPAADSTHHLFAVQEAAPPDYFGESPNNNAMSAVVILDEHGNVVRRIEKFNFYNIYLLDMGDYVQLDPVTSTGFTLGPAGQQLHPFSY